MNQKRYFEIEITDLKENNGMNQPEVMIVYAENHNKARSAAREIIKESVPNEKEGIDWGITRVALLKHSSKCTNCLHENEFHSPSCYAPSPANCGYESKKEVC